MSRSVAVISFLSYFKQPAVNGGAAKEIFVTPRVQTVDIKPGNTFGLVSSQSRNLQLGSGGQNNNVHIEDNMEIFCSDSGDFSEESSCDFSEEEKVLIDDNQAQFRKQKIKVNSEKR